MRVAQRFFKIKDLSLAAVQRDPPCRNRFSLVITRKKNKKTSAHGADAIVYVDADKHHSWLEKRCEVLFPFSLALEKTRIKLTPKAINTSRVAESEIMHKKGWSKSFNI